MNTNITPGAEPTNTDLSEILSLRIPIFNQNKPYVFFRINKKSDKYRLSLSPDFMKQYNLSFRIFRNSSLNSMLQTIGETSHLNTNFGKLDFRLPKKEKQQVIKQTMIVDLNNDSTDRLIIDKYTFLGKSLTDIHQEDTVVFITERNFGDKSNVCLAFISKKYLTINEFLRDLDNLKG
jgi:hypothetical protein